MEEKQSKSKTKPTHHYLRTPLASLFGVLAVVLTFAAIVTVWLDRTLTDTPTFVKTVAPMLEKSEVQQFIASKAADSIVKPENISDLSRSILKPDQIKSKTPDQVERLVKAQLETQIISVIQEPVFISTWRNSLESVHAQTITQLKSNSSEISFDLSPIVTQAIQQLSKTELGIDAKKLETNTNSAKITVKRSDLGPVAKAYDALQSSMIVLLVGALIAALMSVLLSVHHMKTLRRVLMGTGLVSLFVFLLLNLPNVVKTHGIDPVDQAAIVAISNTIFANLKLAFLAVGVVSIAVALGTKFFDLRKKKAAATNKS